MPAYRSPAEAEVRDAVVDRLRQFRPGARIIHEICACFGGNRIDVLAVDRAEIIAVEVKSEKDKIDRLPDQIEGMRDVAHHVIAAIHEKFLIERHTNEWAAYFERGGQYFNLQEPPEAKRSTQTWVFPERRRVTHRDGFDFLYPWQEPKRTIQFPLPQRAIDILWRDEMYEVCGDLGVTVPKRANMSLMRSALLWNVSGGDLTKAICRALRKRECVEADPPILPDGATP